MKRDTRTDFIEALRLARKSIQEASGYIDELHGRLEEIDSNYDEYKRDITPQSRATLRNAYLLYDRLPVLDELEALAFELERTAQEVSDNDN